MFTAKVKMDGNVVCQSTEKDNKKEACIDAIERFDHANLPLNYPLIVEIFYRSHS
jgi:hypothetical protein